MILFLALLLFLPGAKPQQTYPAPGPGRQASAASPSTINYGTVTYDTAQTDNGGYNQWIYFVTGSDVNGYTVNSCSMALAAYATSASTDCILDTALSTTAVGATALCHATYIGTVAASGFQTVPLSGCGALAANTAYWIGENTNGPTSLAFGFSSCGSTCTGTATSGSYTSYYAAGTYGVYTGLNVVLGNDGNIQNSVYITVTPN